MLSLFARILLVVTSLAPAVVTYALAGAAPGASPALRISLIAAAVVFVGVCLAVLRFAARHVQRRPLQVSSIKNTDQEVLGFVLAYLLPLISQQTLQVNLAVALFVIALIFVSVLSSSAYHFNPLLGLFGYHFYEVTDNAGVTYVLLTKRAIRQAPGVDRIVEVSDHLLLEAKE